MLLPVSSGAAAAAPRAGDGVSAPSERCTVDDPRLNELSGLASNGTSWFATNDGGTSLRVFVLDPANCAVREVRTAEQDPYDVEDLALAPGGDVWLADIGDNRGRRETVAMHVLAPGGESELFRMAYPDGSHDAEALLLDRAGVPHIVTKEPFGEAGVYRPTEALTADAAVPLQRVGSLALSSTDSPGGPVASNIGSRMVTGASVSRDGTLVAVRTYTEAYIFHAPDGDVVAALQREPLRVPLPNEPQGEAIAWEPDGTLLSASEGQYPVRAVSGASEVAREMPMATESPDTRSGRPEAQSGRPDSAASQEEPRQSSESMPTGRALILAGCLAVVIMFVGSRLRRR
ncbi:hypothetical protein [Parasphingorhabdus pacifica]